MNEKLLQFIWRFQYFNRSALQTVDGEELQILSPGFYNTNQGPDFLDARIKIGATTLAGHIELHKKTSEWESHKHDTDENYRSVILHVVYEQDQNDPHHLPLLVLKERISTLMLHHYEQLMNTTEFIACAPSIHSVKELTWIAWRERLLAERLTRKADKVLSLLKEANHHWEEVFWWLLARSFGAKVNSDAFEAIARTIPIAILAKHKHSIHQLEALLLGQAGLLSGSFTEAYPQLLQREYFFLQKKHALQSTYVSVHFLRMRPVNFPTVRLAQLAMLIYESSHLFAKILETDDSKSIHAWLSTTANDYWHYHYLLDDPSPYRQKRIGTTMVHTIFINTVVPALFAFGLYHKKDSLLQKAIRWLEETPPEDNTILKGFKELAIRNNTAYDSQTLLELKNEYCTKKRCLECSVGHSILKRIEQLTYSAAFFILAGSCL